MDEEKIYTKEELENIENLASKYNFKDTGVKLGLSENQFLKLRKNHRQVKEAVDRGILARGEDYKSRYSKKLSDASRKSYNVKKMQIKVPNEIDPKTALKKFKEEYEANKYKQSLKELKDIDLI